MSVTTGSLGTADVPASNPSLHGLEGVNFFLAAMLTGFRPLRRRLSQLRNENNAFVPTLELLCAFRSHLFQATLSAPSRITVWNSVQSSSLLTVRLYRLDFHVVLRKLITKLQAFPECIQKRRWCNLVVRLLDDKMLIVSWVFHNQNLPSFRPLKRLRQFGPMFARM